MQRKKNHILNQNIINDNKMIKFDLIKSKINRKKEKIP